MESIIKEKDIRFNRIKDAIFYREVCPLCHHKLSFDDDKNNVTFDENRDIMYITYMSGRQAYIDINSYSMSIDYYKNVDFGNDNAIEYYGLSMECGNCDYYNITYQLILDFKNKKARPISLNSETVTIEDKNTGVIHEIRNIYTTDETEYTHFPKDGKVSDDRSYTFPLLKLDLENPNNTLQKIRKFLVFS